MSKHKTALIFLSVINIINLAAGVISQFQLLKGSDVTSIIPITVEMTVIQILLVNFMAVAILMTLISIVTTYLVTDVSYSPGEILSNCAGVFMIIPAAVFALCAYNAFTASEIVDKISLIVCGAVYLLLNAINFGCILTVKSDMD